MSKTKCNNLNYFITDTSRALWRTYRRLVSTDKRLWRGLQQNNFVPFTSEMNISDFIFMGKFKD
ncbi:hypothetical protein DSB72_00520 [Salmonella enterica subsp. enterica serovar Typhimurium]|nr:hypothetical protein DSB72_00520 [Salmonella enterica subsp. enterica serovar Typhimurium]